jgi:hypothetical protein
MFYSTIKSSNVISYSTYGLLIFHCGFLNHIWLPNYNIMYTK